MCCPLGQDADLMRQVGIGTPPTEAHSPPAPLRPRASDCLTRQQRRCRRSTFSGPLHCPGDEAPIYDQDWRKGMWAIDTHNANCWASAKKALGRSSADATLLQEVRQVEHELPAVRAAARALKRKIAATPALDCGNGHRSAGVAVTTRSTYGLQDLNHLVAPPFRERIAVASASIVERRGVHLISVYLHHYEGASPRNRLLLDEVCRVIAMLQGPFIIGGDFNLAPEAAEHRVRARGSWHHMCPCAADVGGKHVRLLRAQQGPGARGGQSPAAHAV